MQIARTKRGYICLNKVYYSGGDFIEYIQGKKANHLRIKLAGYISVYIRQEDFTIEDKSIQSPGSRDDFPSFRVPRLDIYNRSRKRTS